MTMRHIAAHAEAIRFACDRLTWLEHLFTSIVDDPNASPHARCLGEIGRFVAADVSDFAIDACTDLLETIEKGGAA